MLIFKDNSLINYELLKTWLHHILIKWSLDVTGRMDIERKVWRYKDDGIINSKQHNQM